MMYDRRAYMEYGRWKMERSVNRLQVGEAISAGGSLPGTRRRTVDAENGRGRRLRLMDNSIESR